MTEKVVLNRYSIIESIGRGGYGEVFKAEDTLMGRTVAVKRINISSKASSRTLNEARAAGQLNHPNVVTVYDLEHDDKYYYLIMEYIDGAPLSRILQAKSPFTIEEALDVSIQIADALEAAHAMDIVHRDIKPDNIMVTRDGNVKVTDFGIARLSASTMTAEGDVLGTFAYMSPEQAKGGKIDARTDIFSLGVVIYEMLTGVSPFASATPAGIVFKITNLDPQPLTELNEQVSSDLDSLVLRTLEKKRPARIEDVTILRHYLESMRVAKTPSRKIIKALYKQAFATEQAAPIDYRGPMKPLVDAISSVKETVGSFINKRRHLFDRFANAIIATLLLTYFMSKTGFWASEISGIIPFVYFAAALLFPRVGLTAGFAILFLPVADYSLVVAIFAAIGVFLLMLAFWLTRPAKLVFGGLAPLLSLAGIGLSYPLAAGLLWNPVWAGSIAFLGGLGLELFDLFNGSTLHYLSATNTFALEKTLAGAINPLTAFPDLIKPFFSSPPLILQPLVWMGAAVLVSFIGKRRSLRNDLWGLCAGAAFLLVGQFVLMSAFHWSPAYADLLLKTFLASLILPLGLLTVLPRRSFSPDEDEDEDDDYEEDDE